MSCWFVEILPARNTTRSLRSHVVTLFPRWLSPTFRSRLKIYLAESVLYHLLPGFPSCISRRLISPLGKTIGTCGGNTHRSLCGCGGYRSRRDGDCLSRARYETSA